MGKKAKTSRKGKKAWRGNISTEDIDDFFEKSTKDALYGGSLASVPSESLYFVDKCKDLSVKWKIEKHREKILHCDSVLQKNPFVQAVPSSKVKKSKIKEKEVSKAKDATRDDPKDDSVSASDMVELWGEGNSRVKKVSKPSVIPAVEVEPPGCPFNLSFESHQHILARAVADEMQKVYKDELGPEPVPLTVPDVDHGEDDDDADLENLGENVDDAVENRSSKRKRVTRVELNKRTRCKKLLRKEAAAKKKEEISKEIDCPGHNLPDIIKEIAKEDEEKERRHLRRIVAKQERLKSCPPRLGKHKFEPLPVQVLLSEEITGSLRQLKGRYKSLEKRGLIVPTAKRRRK